MISSLIVWPLLLEPLGEDIRVHTSLQLEDSLCGQSPKRNMSHPRIVLPSVGQTGTTTTAFALRDLGLRVYHIEEKQLFLRAVTQENVTAELFKYWFDRCGIDAMSMEPQTDYLWQVLEAFPDMKVIPN